MKITKTQKTAFILMVILGPIIAYFRFLKVVPDALGFLTYVKIFPKAFFQEIAWTYLGLVIFYLIFFIVFREKKAADKVDEKKIAPPNNN